MATVIETTAERFADLPIAQISMRPDWGDSWTPEPYVYPEEVIATSGASVGSATLIHQFGDLMRRDKRTFEYEDRLIRHRELVKIEFTPQTPSGGAAVRWYGVVLQDERSRLGDDQDRYAGDQRIQCAGLEWFLSRVAVTSSVVEQGTVAGTSFIGPRAEQGRVAIQRGLAFNAGDRGNRSPQTVDDPPIYIFANRPDVDGERWTGRQILEYLLSWIEIFQAPDGPPVRLDPDTAPLLDWYQPGQIKTHGRTLYQLVNQIISPRYGITWSLDYDETDGELAIRVHGLAPSEHSFPGGATLPANSSQRELNFNAAFDIDVASEVLDSSQWYDQIVCLGGYRGAVCTLRTAPPAPNKPTLVPAWNRITDEADYIAGASGEPGYSLADFATQASMNTLARSAPRLRDVFTTFRLPPDWDGKVDDRFLFPELTPSGTVASPEGSEPLWVEGLRFAPWLPLLKGYDYSVSVSFPPLVGQSEDGAGGRLKPFAAFELEDDELPGRYVLADQMNRLSEFDKLQIGDGSLVDQGGHQLKHYSGFSFACRLELSESYPGLAIRPSGPAHLVAGRDWYLADPAAYELGAEIDWRHLVVTGYLQSDTPVKAVWPDVPIEPPYASQAGKLYLRFGDRARQDYIVEDTIVGFNTDGTPKTAPVSGYIRNDHAWLRDIARAAWTWHSADRNAFRFRFRQISDVLRVGDLVTKIGAGPSERPVNSLVTRVAWSWNTSRTTITTQFSESLDFEALV